MSLLSSIFSFPPLPPLLKCPLLRSFHCSYKDSTTLVGLLTSYLASKAVAFFQISHPHYVLSTCPLFIFSCSASLCFTGIVLVGVQTSFFRLCIHYWQIYLCPLHYLGILAPQIFPSPILVCFHLWIWCMRAWGLSSVTETLSLSLEVQLCDYCDRFEVLMFLPLEFSLG